MKSPVVSLHFAGILFVHLFPVQHSLMPFRFDQKTETVRECEDVLTLDNGLIASEGWPNFFTPGYKCRWVRTINNTGLLTIRPIYLDFNANKPAGQCPDDYVLQIRVYVPDALNFPGHSRLWTCSDLRTGLHQQITMPVQREAKMVLQVSSSWSHKSGRFLFSYFVEEAEEQDFYHNDNPSKHFNGDDEKNQYGYLTSPNFPRLQGKLAAGTWTFDKFQNLLFFLAEMHSPRGSCDDSGAHLLKIQLKKANVEHPQLRKSWCGPVWERDSYHWETHLAPDDQIVVSYGPRQPQEESPWAPSFSFTKYMAYKSFLLTWLEIEDSELEANDTRVLTGDNDVLAVHTDQIKSKDFYVVFFPSENGKAKVNLVLLIHDETSCGAELIEYFFYWRPACQVLLSCSEDSDSQRQHRDRVHLLEEFQVKKYTPFVLHMRFPDSRNTSYLSITMVVKHQGNDHFNVALGKRTVQKIWDHNPGEDSTIGNLTSDLAVDGKARDGYEYPSRGILCAQTKHHQGFLFAQKVSWWYVDLGKVYRVHMVHIVSRRNVTDNNLSDFKVELLQTDPAGRADSDQPPRITCMSFPGAPGPEVWIPCPHHAQIGRYVRIIKYKTTDRNLQLCEVEVFVPRDPEEDPDKDCADPIREYRGYSWLSHTAYSIGKSPHYKPLKNCTRRLDDGLHSTGKAYVQIHFTEMDIEESPGCIHDYVQILGKRYCGFHPNGINEFFEVDFNDTAQDIRTMSFVTDGSIERAGFKLWYRVTLLSDLHTGNRTMYLNVALNKSASQASTYKNHVANLAVDNNWTSCASTIPTRGDWWSVDLGQEYKVHSVILITHDLHGAHSGMTLWQDVLNISLFTENPANPSSKSSSCGSLHGVVWPNKPTAFECHHDSDNPGQSDRARWVKITATVYLFWGYSLVLCEVQVTVKHQVEECGQVTTAPGIMLEGHHVRYHELAPFYPNEVNRSDSMCEETIPVGLQRGTNLLKVNEFLLGNMEVDRHGFENPNGAPDCLGDMIIVGSNRHYLLLCGRYVGRAAVLYNFTVDADRALPVRWLKRTKPSYHVYHMIPRNKTFDMQFLYYPECTGLTTIGYNTSKVFHVSSPLYPEFYPPSLNCEKTIAFNFTGYVRIVIVDNDIHDPDQTCPNDVLILQYERSGSETSKRYCGWKNVGSMVLPVDNTIAKRVRFIFKSDSINRVTSGRGFSVALLVLKDPECGGVLITNMTFQNVGYPHPDHPVTQEQDCVWSYYTGHEFGTAFVKMENINLHKRNNRCVDYIKIKFNTSDHVHTSPFMCGTLRNFLQSGVMKRFSTVEIHLHQMVGATPGFYKISFWWEKAHTVFDPVNRCGWESRSGWREALRPPLNAYYPPRTRTIQMPPRSLRESIYGNLQDCRWDFFRTRNHAKLTFEFEHFDLEDTEQCSGDRFFIFPLPLFYCGSALHGRTIVGYVAKMPKKIQVSNVLPIIFFQSDISIGARGFKVHVTAVVMKHGEFLGAQNEKFAINYRVDKYGHHLWVFEKGLYVGSSLALK